MLMIPFLKTATIFNLICRFVAVKAVAQHTRRQQDVNADFDGLDPASEFDIDITKSDDPGWTVNDTFESFFQGAQEKWPTVITGDLVDVELGSTAGTNTNSLGGQFGTCPYPESIDDLWICASANDLGGPSEEGQILAYATVLNLRTGDRGLPVAGVIAFNNQALGEIDDDRFSAVTLHEIGHVLGIGTLWELFDLATSDDRPCDYASSSKASDEYRDISGCNNAVPLEESTGSPGSDCGHWEERCFTNELMTPFNNESDDPLSRVTVATLDDLGYEVDYSDADSYNGFSAACSCNRDPASTHGTTTTKMNPDETRRDKRSLQDAAAIAKGKEIVAAMINAAPGPDDTIEGLAPNTNPWVNIVWYDIDTKTTRSYIVTAADL